MQQSPIRIGTRESQLAVWQATKVKELLQQSGRSAMLVYIKSEGDADLATPLYAMGVQGVFTRSLDAALLNNRIDIAVHSMKDVPVGLPGGVIQAAVLKRASHKDILVSSPHPPADGRMVIATGSIRRRAQWLHRYPGTVIENLRGNVNTRLRKVAEHNWTGAIFAAAGLERIGLRPQNSSDLDWMLPAPAQGAILVVCREDDKNLYRACNEFSDHHTEIAVKAERDFLNALMGGCSTPISALAVVQDRSLHFKGNIVLPDGSQKAGVEKILPADGYTDIGKIAAEEILKNGGREIVEKMAEDGI